jgi:tetratricopeptide (TPR) repeat protein
MTNRDFFSQALRLFPAAALIIAGEAAALLGCAGGADPVKEPAAVLDETINYCAGEIEKGLEQGVRVAVVGFEADSPTFSTYIMEEFMNRLMSGRKVAVADRQDLDLLYREITFSESGFISAETTLSMGKMLGAQIVVTGTVIDTEKTMYLQVKAFNTLTSEQIFFSTRDLEKTKSLIQLLADIESSKVVAKALSQDFHQNTNEWNDADRYLWEGNLFYQKRMYDEAIENFDKAIGINPIFCMAYNFRGLAYYEKGNFDAAFANFNFIINFNPQDLTAYSNRGAVYERKKEYDKAIADYNKALDINPNEAAVYVNRGSAYFWSGMDYEQAFSDYNKALSIAKNAVFMWYRDAVIGRALVGRGEVYLKTNDIEKALADFNEAIGTGNKQEAYISRGYLYELQYDYDKAIADYSEAIKLDPRDVDAYVYRCNVYIYMNDRAKALADLEEAVKIDPHDPNVAVLHRKLGQ